MQDLDDRRELRDQRGEQEQEGRRGVPRRDVDAGDGQDVDRDRLLQTGIKADVKQFSGPHAAYFTELMERQKGSKYFIGQPRDMVTGECKDAFAQVLNPGFPGGLLSVDQTVQAMNKACYKG
jgi:hypothetical protein